MMNKEWLLSQFDTFFKGQGGDKPMEEIDLEAFSLQWHEIMNNETYFGSFKVVKRLLLTAKILREYDLERYCGSHCMEDISTLLITGRVFDIYPLLVKETYIDNIPIYSLRSSKEMERMARGSVRLAVLKEEGYYLKLMFKWSVRTSFYAGEDYEGVKAGIENQEIKRIGEGSEKIPFPELHQRLQSFLSDSEACFSSFGVGSYMFSYHWIIAEKDLFGFLQQVYLWMDEEGLQDDFRSIIIQQKNKEVDWLLGWSDVLSMTTDKLFPDEWRKALWYRN